MLVEQEVPKLGKKSRLPLNRLFLSVLLFFFCACDLPNKQTRPLVSVDEISNLLLRKSGVQIIDVRHPDEYLSGHIPGAVNIWSREYQIEDFHSKEFHINKFAFENLLGSKGLNARDSIFLYDAKGNYDAAQIWWLLNYYGFDKVALIDGGLISWQLVKKNLRSGYEDVTPRTFVLVGLEKKELLTNIKGIQHEKFDQIVDSRSKEEYGGKIIKNGAFRGGHIPGAIWLDHFELMNPNNFQLKSTDDIRQIMKTKGLNAHNSTVVYGHNELGSAFAIFVFTEILKMNDVSNYGGSWAEWSEDESLPIEKAEN